MPLCKIDIIPFQGDIFSEHIWLTPKTVNLVKTIFPFQLGTQLLDVISFGKHDRSSHLRRSIRIGVLKNFTKFTGKHLCESLVAGQWHLFYWSPLDDCFSDDPDSWQRTYLKIFDIQYSENVRKISRTRPQKLDSAMDILLWFLSKSS